MNQDYNKVSELPDLKVLMDKMQLDSKIYIYNLMSEIYKEYKDQDYTSLKESYIDTDEKKHDLFTEFSDTEMQTNIVTAMEGFGNFGKFFIANVIDKDPASAKVLFETIMQDYLDLQKCMEDFIKSM